MEEGFATKCISVSKSRTKAVISVDMSEKIITPLSCTNSESCHDRGLLRDGVCPQYCEIIISAKRYSQNRRVNAEIDEISPENCKDMTQFVKLGSVWNQ
jgi:hypothetical protein